jgi:segregation and condensation protein B
MPRMRIANGPTRGDSWRDQAVPLRWERMRVQEVDIERSLEALLFVADGPVMVHDLARALEADVDAVEAAIERLSALLAGRGLAIGRVGTRVQMVSAPDLAPAIERFLGINSASRLSPAALEALAVIAYRQPVTRAQVEAIRGVNSDAVIRTLLARSLVQVVGQLDQAGRPEVLGTTFEFLQYFGIRSLSELPQLPELEEISAPSTDQGSAR